MLWISNRKEQYDGYIKIDRSAKRWRYGKTQASSVTGREGLRLETVMSCTWHNDRGVRLQGMIGRIMGW